MSEAATQQRQNDLVWSYLKGFHAVHHVAVGLDTGLLAHLATLPEGATPTALAVTLGLHAPYVDVWCKAGYAYEFLDADDAGRYRFAPFMREILAKAGDPRFLGAYLKTMAGFGSADFARYAECFRTGETHRFQDHGHDFSRHIAATTEGFHVVVAKKLLPGLPGLKEKLETGCRILDLGCGTAGLMIKLAEAWPSVACTGVDIDPHGVAQARTNIARAGLGGRIVVEELGGEGMRHKDSFDVVTLFEVIHEITPDQRAPALAGAFRALKPGGILFAIDETMPSRIEDLRKPEYGMAVQTAFNELIWGNQVPTREEQEALIKGAGFIHLHREMVAGQFTLLVARKP